MIPGVKKLLSMSENRTGKVSIRKLMLLPNHEINEILANANNRFSSKPAVLYL